MDPRDIRKNFGPSHEIQERMYQSYIAPLINGKCKQLPYFFGEAWKAWVIKISKEDIANVKFIEDICNTCFKGDQQTFIEIVSNILGQGYESNVRVVEAYDDLSRSEIRGSIEGIYKNQLALYKTLFESEFRLFATVPYYYLASNNAIRHKGTSAESFVNISGGEKFDVLSKFMTLLPQGDIRDFTKGFDNRIRNAGSGHDSWHITDDDTVILKVVNPSTGKVIETRELDQKQIGELIKQCNRTLWVLRVGIALFLENNAKAGELFYVNKTVTLREIIDSTNAFAENRLLKLKNFDLNKSENILSFTIEHTPQIIGRGTQIFFGTAEAYDVIHKRERVKFEYQVLDVLKYLLHYYKKTPLSFVKVNLIFDNQNLGVFTYSGIELEKLFIEEGEPQIPKPEASAFPDLECIMHIPLKVPYGMRVVMEAEMKAKGWDIV